MKNQETITLKSAVDAYLAHLAENQTKATTVNVYRRSLDIALLYFGTEKEIIGITLPMVGKFFKSDQLNVHPNGKPKAAPTVKQIKRVFRQCLEYAKDQGLVEFLPIPKSEMQHARSKRQVSSQSKSIVVEQEIPVAGKPESSDHEAKIDS